MSFNPGGGGGIAGASDVALSNPVNNDAFLYESATQKWKNAALTKSQVGLANVDNTSDVDKPISTAVQTALSSRPTAAEVSQQIATETADLATSAQLSAATQGLKKIFVLANPSAPTPAEAVQGDIIFVPVEALLPITWSFTGAGLSSGTTITTSTAAPNSFGQVANAPQWDGSDIVIPNAAPNANVRPEGRAPGSGEWSFGFEFVFGAPGDTVAPNAGAPWLYAFNSSDTNTFRLSLSSSFQIQFRNSAGSVVSGGTSSALTAGTRYFVTVYGTVGTDMVSVRVRRLSDGNLFYSNDQAVGSTAALDDVICGRQSGSLQFNTVMKMRRMVYATVAQELYQW